MGESNPPTPFPGQLVSNQSPKPIRLPSVLSGPDRSRTDHTDLARISRLHRHAGPCCVQSRETRVQSQTLEDGLSGSRILSLDSRSSSVIPDGLEPSFSWMSARRLHHWTTGSDESRVECRESRSAFFPSGLQNRKLSSLDSWLSTLQ